MQLGNSFLVRRCSCRMGVDKTCTGYRGAISLNGAKHLTWTEVCAVLDEEKKEHRVRSSRKKAS